MELVKPENKMTLRGHTGEDQIFELDKDFRPLAFSANGGVEGEVVFTGYGLTKPGELGVGYNSYGGLDVKGKIVMVLRYVPEDISIDRRQELNRYAGLRYKALIARNKGVARCHRPELPKPRLVGQAEFRQQHGWRRHPGDLHQRQSR